MGGPVLLVSDFLECQSCICGKMIQSPSTSSFTRASNILDVVHTDLMGPISPPTPSGKKYILTFINDHSRNNRVYLLKSKDETYETFLHYKAWAEKRANCQIHKLKSDRGGEYSSNQFMKCLLESGIETERGPAHRPQANSVAEQFNRTLLG